ncbi:MAG: hypothetical protein L3K19_09465, partial [Thermoplasmata archaeon]|nr:hypothetical protein [Thermoplasmata archaeon]
MYFWVRCATTAALNPGYIGVWVGSAGTNATTASCSRQTFFALVLDFASAAAGHSAPIILSNYQDASTPPNPGFTVNGLLFHSALTNPVFDVRQTPVFDYKIADGSGERLIDSNYNSFLVNGQPNRVGVTPSVSIGPANSTGIVLAATFKMAGFAKNAGPTVFIPAAGGLGKVKATFVVAVSTSVAADGVKIDVRAGLVSGGIPNQGDAVTGVSGLQNTLTETATTGNNNLGTRTYVAFFSGLTPGVQYWFDMAIAFVTTGGTGALQQATCIFEDLPA